LKAIDIALIVAWNTVYCYCNKAHIHHAWITLNAGEKIESNQLQRIHWLHTIQYTSEDELQYRPTHSCWPCAASRHFKAVRHTDLRSHI